MGVTMIFSPGGGGGQPVFQEKEGAQKFILILMFKPFILGLFLLIFLEFSGYF
jgi:hypothetical protein